MASDCLGLLADITQRKEKEVLAQSRDELTGLGNRIALMQALDGLGPNLGKALFALVDIDRFKPIHASLGDDGADQVLRQTARRLQGLKARLFRAGGNSFALLFDEAPREAKAAGDTYWAGRTAALPFRPSLCCRDSLISQFHRQDRLA